MTITLNMAKGILAAGVKHAEITGNSCSIAVVDESGWLIALHRMDGAPMPTANIARDKAWTASVFRMPSSEIGKFGDPSKPGFGLNPTKWNDQLTTIPGGLLITVGGEVIGGIGVSGMMPDQDVAICEAAINVASELSGE